VDPVAIPKEIKEALRLGTSLGISGERPLVSGRFSVDGETYFATFRALGESQDWNVGVIAPEKFYLGSLGEMRTRLLMIAGLMMLAIIFGGTLLGRVVQRAQQQIVKETKKMNNFVFTPTPYTSNFADVAAALDSLEKAKTAMRALGKYVPLDLVRRLYGTKQDPTLGGELMEVTVMFTDIKDFTTISEKLSPNELAKALGRYLEVMVQVIQNREGGTIDKFIGDSIMAIWNAPAPVPNHAVASCRAALHCLKLSAELFQSEGWRGLPNFHTRYGMHMDWAMVGNFGAPDRINYTAIGDGVNLASRLEGLNKHYGTSIIVSQAVYEAAKSEFEFRLLDRVAVKGKSRGVAIYELLGNKGTLSQHDRSVVERYEQAFNEYLQRRFKEAIAILEVQPEDPPSANLLGRCREFLVEAPPGDWEGVFHSESK
jgi:adenylate cyclase